MLEIQVDHTINGFTICRPIGELDAYTVRQFRDELAELATTFRLLVDISAVTFIDSAGLGALIGGLRRVRETGGDVAVACSRPGLNRLLRTVGFDWIAIVAETVDDAIAEMESGSLAN